MTFHPKKLVANYFKKKKPFSIITDVIVVVIIAMLLIPATRNETAAFFIRLTSFPPATLNSEEQFVVNKQTQNWQLYDLKGNQTSFDKLNNKPVFLNIWATWCPPCIAELPSIQELYKDYGDKINFVLISNENIEKVQKFAAEHQYTELPFYRSPAVPQNFSTNSIPATFIINKNGKVVVSKKGAARWNTGTTRELLDRLLNE